MIRLSGGVVVLVVVERPVIDRGGGDRLRVRIDTAIFLVELL